MICMGAVNLMLAIVMVTLSMTRRIYPGFHLWTLAFVSASVGSVLIALREVLPSFLSLVVGNFGIVGFGLLISRGLAVFLGQRHAPAFEALCLTILSAGLIWTSYIQPVSSHRTVVVMSVFLAFTLRLAWLAYRGNRKPPGWRRLALGLHGQRIHPVLHRAHRPSQFVSPPPATFLDQGPAQGITLLLFTLFSIGSMCAAVSLNSRRLEYDLSKSESVLQRQRTELEKANHELSELAVRDGLTGLYNRRHFDEVLEQEWRRLGRARRPLSLVLLDIDHFKEFNDLYGHQKGDEALMAVAKAAEFAVQRPSDVSVRYGGEEFALVLPETAAAGAHSIAERVAAGIRDSGISHDASQVSSQLTASFGVATVVPGAGTTSQTLVALADEALYRSKNEGRDRITMAAAEAAPSERASLQ